MNEETLACRCGRTITRPVGVETICGCGEPVGPSFFGPEVVIKTSPKHDPSSMDKNK